MPRHCSAAGCKSRDTSETRKNGVTFHRLPKRGNPRRLLWLANCRRTDPESQAMWDPKSQFIYFCSRHFTKDSFELVGTSGYHRLKDDALPTIFETFSKMRHVACARNKQVKQDSDMGSSKVPMKRSRSQKLMEDDKSTLIKGTTSGRRGRKPRTEIVQIAGTSSTKSLQRSQDILNGQEESEIVPAKDVELSSQMLSPGVNCCAPARVQEENPTSQLSSESEVARPVSPSMYMSRLPPPPGAYISKEHSYGVGSPLFWKARAEFAFEAMEVAQRQLSACRRREIRLRQRLAALTQERKRESMEAARLEHLPPRGRKRPSATKENRRDTAERCLETGRIVTVDEREVLSYCRESCSPSEEHEGQEGISLKENQIYCLDERSAETGLDTSKEAQFVNFGGRQFLIFGAERQTETAVTLKEGHLVSLLEEKQLVTLGGAQVFAMEQEPSERRITPFLLEEGETQIVAVEEEMSSCVSEENRLQQILTLGRQSFAVIAADKHFETQRSGSSLQSSSEVVGVDENYSDAVCSSPTYKEKPPTTVEVGVTWDERAADLASWSGKHQSAASAGRQSPLDLRERLKEHLQVFELQLIGDFDNEDDVEDV
ncbi:THAP domain-containing protein 7 isoform X1 [Erpetoichthys calabaricus]|uniref:THAP-type domain-containing protein n=2 Tax=Erpetoichthys calabaricus TaxID=27687 RepID=A0A8C4X916_ERPCA|nr:THAP domain-containing protein 7 isoform X1 [Erpetoichthys calabaricus]XP_028669382.1 THAP domain-containing protein 7 isoform X1 [Erpetoichthys calabaricus]XP_028669384.1 THAP domain-containing protein 7 isoform X1 [Erpetoichthys calabaricus]XP_028669385.1 THAP domain-containing protein 7 isoform X1 [Erpetoichthys calabaricus]XP_051789842.1 THAP domain-containing protein 7 isoform X1 [Erpetoichthys calabaricus]